MGSYFSLLFSVDVFLDVDHTQRAQALLLALLSDMALRFQPALWQPQPHLRQLPYFLYYLSILNIHVKIYGSPQKIIYVQINATELGGKSENEWWHPTFSWSNLQHNKLFSYNLSVIVLNCIDVKQGWLLYLTLFWKPLKKNGEGHNYFGEGVIF